MVLRLDDGETAETRDLWAVRTDQHFTRRKRFHHVLDPQGENRFTSGRFGEVMQFLSLNGIIDFWLVFEDRRYRVKVTDEHSL